MDNADSGTPKKPGRPRRTDWQEPYLTNLAIHGVQAWSCRDIGVSQDTVHEERKRDDVFAARYDAAIEESTAALERRAIQWAAAGVATRTTVTRTLKDGSVETTVTEGVEMSPTLLIFLLKSRRPAVYRDNIRVEQTGADGGPIQIRGEEIDREIDRLVDEVSARREAKAARGASR